MSAYAYVLSINGLSGHRRAIEVSGLRFAAFEAWDSKGKGLRFKESQFIGVEELFTA